MKNMFTIVVVAIIIVAMLIGYNLVIKPHFNEFNKLKRYQTYTDTTDLRMQGGTRTFGNKGFNNPCLNYDLRSWDAGKNWYVIDYNYDTEELKILGLVDTIYPGLLEHLISWDKITNYVQENGPISFTDSTGVKILKNAGFTIKVKKIETNK